MDGYTLVFILSMALAARVVHLYLFEDSHAFWTAGPVRRAILRGFMRLRERYREVH